MGGCSPPPRPPGYATACTVVPKKCYKKLKKNNLFCQIFINSGILIGDGAGLPGPLWLCLCMLATQCQF